MIKRELVKRGLPDPLVLENGELIRDIVDWEIKRKKIKELLCFNEYGSLPAQPNEISFEVLDECLNYFSSTGIYRKILITVDMKNGVFSFPICFIQPKTPQKHKTIIHVSFSGDIPNKYMPCEEISDNGFAVASFCYQDITSDDADFSDKLPGVLFNNKQRGCTDAGKIMMWAWAAMRVMDFLQTQESVDLNNVAVAGHSRLGKAALVAAAFDDRFAFVHSNNSGCSGAAISRQKCGESIDDICRRFPYWFCENYEKYRCKEDKLPFDQHYLLSLIAPRHISVASAEEDSWADPRSEFLCCAAASHVYSLYERDGLIAPSHYPSVGEVLHNGSIGYYVRSGSHYFSRYDWNRFMEFINIHTVQGDGGANCYSVVEE